MKLIKIRKGEKSDLPCILNLIKELAQYENALDKVDIGIQELEIDGFSKNPLFYFLVAEINSNIVGMAFYYIKYSTWTGKCLFLEDFIVTKKFRRQGVGEKLFNEIILIAKKLKMNRIMWQVLNWNKPAINFYKKYNSDISDNWLDGKITKKQIENFTLK